MSDVKVSPVAQECFFRGGHWTEMVFDHIPEASREKLTASVLTITFVVVLEDSMAEEAD